MNICGGVIVVFFLLIYELFECLVAFIGIRFCLENLL